MQEVTLQTALLDAFLRVLRRGDHPLAGVYRTIVSLATRHHAILIQEPLFGGGSVLALAVAAEILGVPPHLSHTHADLLFIPSDGALITKDKMQETTAKLATSPQGDLRVVVWEDMTRMNASSANAFLKTLEEPDSSTLFLLTTTSKERLLPTITSRVIDVSIELSLLAEVTEDVLRDAPEHLRELALGRPALAAALMLEQKEKQQPLTEMMREGVTLAEQLLSADPKQHLQAYVAILRLKEREKKKQRSILPVRPLHLLCFILEGTIEKMLHSPMISPLPARAQDMAARILRFRQDIDANVSTKLAALDLVFGLTKDTPIQ